MEKKVYIKPSIKVSAIEAETLMAGSVTTITQKTPDNDTDENQFSKKNTFSSVWEDDEY